jgi:CIC family chloride channel protein
MYLLNRSAIIISGPSQCLHDRPRTLRPFSTKESLCVSALTLRRSILTEKVARRGYHLSREYATDPLEILFTREAMRTDIVALRADMPPRELAERLRMVNGQSVQRLYPIVDDENHLTGVVTLSQLHDLLAHQPLPEDPGALAALVKTDPVVAYPDEPLRAVVFRMAETGLTRLPVVDHTDARRLLGMISLRALLTARGLNLEAERRRERVLPLRLTVPWRSPARAQVSTPLHFPFRNCGRRRRGVKRVPPPSHPHWLARSPLNREIESTSVAQVL